MVTVSVNRRTTGSGERVTDWGKHTNSLVFHSLSAHCIETFVKTCQAHNFMIGSGASDLSLSKALNYPKENIPSKSKQAVVLVQFALFAISAASLL